LCDCDALWHPVRKKRTARFIYRLNRQHKFLEKGEDGNAFARTYKFGASQQHYRHHFHMPTENPTGWWRDGHQFSGQNCYGIHEDFKPFLKLLFVPLGKNAYDDDPDEEKDNEDNDGEDNDREESTEKDDNAESTESCESDDDE
jgi:hypothetical protein